MIETILSEQQEYYRARAGEYDEWFLRQGRYDRGPEANRTWFNEVEEVNAALTEFRPRGHVLEIAAGTGLWTERLTKFTDQITAMDYSPEVLERNKARVGDRPIRYVVADLFTWTPDQQYDTVFFSFWLSHVPPERFDAFWSLVRQCLAPHGSVFFIDNRYAETSIATDHQLGQSGEVIRTRKLNDGREFRIIKAFYEPTELTTKLRALGWTAGIYQTANYFLYGSCRIANLSKHD